MGSDHSTRKSNKIGEVVGLRVLLMKWRNFTNPSTIKGSASHDKMITSINFLKRKLSSLTDNGNNKTNNRNKAKIIPKGYVPVCVGEELRQFIIPTQYLSHPAFCFLLREAEEEFGFQQQGVLSIPCEVSVFERVLKTVNRKRKQEIITRVMKVMASSCLVVKDRCRLSVDARVLKCNHRPSSP